MEELGLGRRQVELPDLRLKEGVQLAGEGNDQSGQLFVQRQARRTCLAHWAIVVTHGIHHTRNRNT